MNNILKTVSTASIIVALLTLGSSVAAAQSVGYGGGGDGGATVVLGGPSSGGGGGGGSSAPAPVVTTGSSSTPAGQVLGAETDISNVSPTSTAMCSTLYISSYMRIGKPNNASDVTKLQTFLNANLGISIPVTGFFGPLTKAAVEQFQTKYAVDVLTPWGITAPTGYVYKTTERWINLLNCASLNIPLQTN